MNNAFLNSLKKQISKIPRKVTLVAVTKYAGIEETNEIIKAGVSAIGENRIEDAEKKFPHLLSVEKHFIGQIQSRKIKRIVELFDVIQSISSVEHLIKIEEEATRQRKGIRVLLQFNISGESRKGGFDPNSVARIGEAIPTASSVNIVGVMGMASQTNDEEIVRNQFRLLKSIRDELRAKYPSITELSMGMSDDYKIALEEGATILRIGRALFNLAHL